MNRIAVDHRDQRAARIWAALPVVWEDANDAKK
jgi:hypothetical protein